MGRSGADAAINEDDTKRGSEACAFFRVLLVSFYFFWFGFFPKRMGPRPKP